MGDHAKTGPDSAWRTRNQRPDGPESYDSTKPNHNNYNNSNKNQTTKPYLPSISHLNKICLQISTFFFTLPTWAESLSFLSWVVIMPSPWFLCCHPWSPLWVCPLLHFLLPCHAGSLLFLMSRAWSIIDFHSSCSLWQQGSLTTCRPVSWQTALLCVYTWP